MTDQQVKDLLKRYLEGECTEEERLQVDSWNYERYTNTGDFKAKADYDQVSQRTWDSIARLQKDTRPQKTLKLYRYWPVAAAIAVLFATGYLYFIYGDTNKKQDLYTYNKAHDITAGGNKAVLTLANGQQIVLDSAVNGTIASQGGVTVTKNKNGLIVYDASPVKGGSRGVVAYNTIATPNGGQYEVVLPDGSHVYLNAASSLKYPVKFNGADRRVDLEGEAYFEITKNPAKPFIVFSSNQSVKVLGTHFNLSAYTNEKDIKTTLLEGKVEISLLPVNNNLPLNNHYILKPGQQAVNKDGSIQLTAADTTAVTAWKEGLFVFRQNSLKEICMQISRWYNVDIDYNSLPDTRFDGVISRDLPLSEMLRAIEKTNHVKFIIEGRKIRLLK